MNLEPIDQMLAIHATAGLFLLLIGMVFHWLHVRMQRQITYFLRSAIFTICMIGASIINWKLVNNWPDQRAGIWIGFVSVECIMCFFIAYMIIDIVNGRHKRYQ